MNARNDPIPGQPYGECMDCGLELPSEAAANEHMRTTHETAIPDRFGSKSGHRVQITNPTREERIGRQVEQILIDAINAEPGETNIWTRELDITGDAVETAIEVLQDAVTRGDMHPNEVTKALACQPEFLGPWRDQLPDHLAIPEEQLDLLEGLPS